MKKLEQLTIDQLVPGMRVAVAVVDAAGRVLLPTGAELSESTLASLRRREIEAVSVEIEVEDDPAALAAHRAKVAAQLDQLFRRAGREGPTGALYQAIAQFRLEHRT